MIILIVPIFIIGMFSIHTLRSFRRMSHKVMGKMNALISFVFSKKNFNFFLGCFYLANFLISLNFVGKSMRQFGTGVVNILNKVEGDVNIEPELSVNLKEGQKEVVLQLD